MKRRIFNIKREPGFRLNIADALFIVFLFFIAYLCRIMLSDSSIFLIPLYLAYSFFLFCNVFRIGNRLEPYWYIPFTLLAAYFIYINNLFVFWLVVLFILEPFKWILIVRRIRQGSYVGVFFDRLNRS